MLMNLNRFECILMDFNRFMGPWAHVSMGPCAYGPGPSGRTDGRTSGGMDGPKGRNRSEYRSLGFGNVYLGKIRYKEWVWVRGSIKIRIYNCQYEIWNVGGGWDKI